MNETLNRVSSEFVISERVIEHTKVSESLGLAVN
jgi:hypothetical protein